MDSCIEFYPFIEMLYCEPQKIDIKTLVIPLPMSYRTNKNKYTTTVNRKKHLATCAKNRRNRKSKKRKNR